MKKATLESSKLGQFSTSFAQEQLEYKSKKIEEMESRIQEEAQDEESIEEQEQKLVILTVELFRGMLELQSDLSKFGKSKENLIQGSLSFSLRLIQLIEEKYLIEDANQEDQKDLLIQDIIPAFEQKDEMIQRYLSNIKNIELFLNCINKLTEEENPTLTKENLVFSLPFLKINAENKNNWVKGVHINNLFSPNLNNNQSITSPSGP